MSPRRLVIPARLTSGVALILAGSIAGQGVIVLASPLLTRLYGAEDFGALAVVTSLSSIGGAVVTSNWERAVVVPRSSRVAGALVSLAILSTVVVSGVLALLAWTAREWLADTLNAPFLLGQWWILPVTVAAIGLFKVFSSTLTRRQAYGRLGLRNGMQGWAQVVFNVVMGFAAVGGSLGLTLGTAIGRLFAVLGAGRGRRGAVRHEPPWKIVPGSRTIAVAWARFRRLPLVSTWSSLLNVLGLQAPILLLTAAYGVFEIGFVALTMRVLAAPVGIIADATAQYVEGSLGALIRRRGPLVPLVGRTERVLALLVLLPLVAVVLGGPTVFTVVFGPEWETAGHYARVFALAYAFQLVVAPVSRVLLLVDRTHVQLAWDVTRSVVVLGAVGVAIRTDASLMTTVVVLASAQSIMYLVLHVLVRRAVRMHDSRTSADGTPR